MSRPFLVPLRFVNLIADPGSASEGDTYWNSSTDKLRIYLNGSWTDASYTAPTIGSTQITSGGTFTTLPGVTSVNGTTIPSSTTLIDASSTSQTKTGNFTSSGDISAGGILKSTASSGDEGGQIDLTKSATNTTLTTGVSIDVYQNKLRIFETGGTNRGYYLDISAGGASAETNIIGGGGGAFDDDGNIIANQVFG